MITQSCQNEIEIRRLCSSKCNFISYDLILNGKNREIITTLIDLLASFCQCSDRFNNERAAWILGMRVRLLRMIALFLMGIPNSEV